MDFNFATLYDDAARLYASVAGQRIRPTYDELDSGGRFIGIRGSRGVGKSTLLK